jgi:hypothetical protein
MGSVVSHELQCQESRGEIPDFQVGKGKEMNSIEISYQQGELMEEDLCGVVIHMNEMMRSYIIPLSRRRIIGVF